MDDCAGKGFEMLLAAWGHLTLPSLQLLFAGFAELPQVCRPHGCAALQELCCPCCRSCSVVKSVSFGCGRCLGVREKCRSLLVSGLAGGSPGSAGAVQMSCSLMLGC